MVKRYFDRAIGLATSGTAKDTYILFVGNLLSAFLSFIFTLLVARALSVSDFGIFSAASNLVLIVYSLGDLGITGGMLNFVAKAYAEGKKEEEGSYLKATFILRFIVVSALSLLIFIFARMVSISLLATEDPRIAYWVAAISFGYIFEGFFTPVLQAEKRFLESTVVFNSLSLARPILAFLFILSGGLTLATSLFSFAVGTIFPLIAGFWFTGFGFLLARARRDVYLRLAKFSGWIGVNRIISAISGRLDIQMLAAIAGASATGIYSISSRLASFVVVLASSFSSVLAPRFASFGAKSEEKRYLRKATLASFGIAILVGLWILVAKPFILLLFGYKYSEAIPIFQVLAASMIPFLFAIPPTTAIIYSLKKPIYIGAFSFFQLVGIFFLNLLLIPKYGVFGPTISFAAVNSILAIYSWAIVINHYWLKR